jgi:hypothetical protein
MGVFLESAIQCCGSGAFLTPGSGIRDEQPESYFLELRNHFFGLKYLNSLMRIRDGDSSDAGFGMEKSLILDKHPGSETLPKSSVGDPEHFGAADVYL